MSFFTVLEARGPKSDQWAEIKVLEGGSTCRGSGENLLLALLASGGYPPSWFVVKHSSLQSRLHGHIVAFLSVVKFPSGSFLKDIYNFYIVIIYL